MRGKLIAFSQYDCLEVPKAGNILRLCQYSACYLFIDKPFAAILEMGKGIPREHHRFWDEKGVLGLYQLVVQ